MKKNERSKSSNVCYVLIVIVAVICLLAAGTLTGVRLMYRLIYGRTTVYTDISDYGKRYHKGVNSALSVFPQDVGEGEQDEYYFRLQDEIFSPVCQIYLKKKYTPDQFEKEQKRLEELELSYQGQVNNLYLDTEHYSNPAYVAAANWNDRFEYAIMLENLNTVIYVYLQNMNEDEIRMDQTFLPSYFEDDNAGSYGKDAMDELHRSFYAFQIGSEYVECMDLAK